MYNNLLALVIITLLNLICISIGFFLGYVKVVIEKGENIKEVFKGHKEEVLEEAYIPEED